jgi:preprotein translocase subunit SecD
LTSMFSAVFFSRGLVNLFYGSKKKLKSVSIGTVWRPDGALATPGAGALAVGDAEEVPAVPARAANKPAAKSKK